MRKAFKMNLFIGILVILLTLTACGVDGDYKTNKAPIIEITSFEGDLISNPESDSLVFQQKIYWHAYDEDGTIQGIAFRVLDSDGNPIATAGNDYIDADGSVEPITIQGQSEFGWVVHYQEGADENISLPNSPSQTIWTNEKYAVINFPANDNGEPIVDINSVEVICIDNRGTISEEIYTKFFRITSLKPDCSLSTTKGDPDGGRVGTGINLQFRLLSSDEPLAVNTPYYYDFKVLKKAYTEDDENYSDDQILTETDWISTKELPSFDTFMLTRSTTPSISTDFDSDEEEANQLTYTEVIARCYNLAEVRSEPDTLRFAVKEGFHPETIIYSQKTYALGQYHYVDYADESDPEVYPFQDMEDPTPDRYATTLFVDSTDVNTAINSNDLKIFTSWGYHGEYGQPPSGTGAYTITDNPHDKKINKLRDEDTGIDYYSEIVAYDIRLDGEAYDFFALQDNIVLHEEEDGTTTEWLRVYINSVWDIAQQLELANLPSGDHVLQISAYDLQDQYDPTPAELRFNISDYTPSEERSGILVIDADIFTGTTDADIDQFYQNVTADLGDVTFVNRVDIVDNSQFLTSTSACVLSTSDLLKFKTIIYHDESPSASWLQQDYDAINIFLAEGGNMIISASLNLMGMNQKLTNRNLRLFERYFGVTYANDAVDAIGTNQASDAFFIGATPEGTLPAINLEIEETFSPIVNLRKGLGAIAFFTEDGVNSEADFDVSVAYRYNSKAIDHPSFPPSQEQFDAYNGVPVALKRETVDNKCYIFGFPLSFMVESEVKGLLEEIIE
ncbi:MAG: hypothetical protein B6226_00900 [Candidatus Cloacimonetes bacterium 4572_65]|nr:MAG: hypothetical protein B6226_00900 [Candidatus Cloacimonetes bacterium 4572_65]